MTKFFEDIIDKIEAGRLDGAMIATVRDGSTIDSIEIYGKELGGIFDLEQLDDAVTYICQTDEIPVLGKRQKEGVFVLNGSRWQRIDRVEIETPDELLELPLLEGKAVIFLDACYKPPRRRFR